MFPWLKMVDWGGECIARWDFVKGWEALVDGWFMKGHRALLLLLWVLSSGGLGRGRSIVQVMCFSFLEISVLSILRLLSMSVCVSVCGWCQHVHTLSGDTQETQNTAGRMGGSLFPLRWWLDLQEVSTEDFPVGAHGTRLHTPHPNFHRFLADE